MRTRNAFLAAVLFSIPVLLSAQVDSFRFENQLADTGSMTIDHTYLDDHYLGETVAVKMHRLKETYTYIEQGTPSSPGDKIMVNKPAIYYALKKLNKYYKRELRKGRIERSEAYDKLCRYLDIGYAIYSQDTGQFENELRSVRKPPAIDQVFARVVLE